MLSSAYTSLGPQVEGEGLSSLRRAFLMAGAKSILSSLWKVDDQATAELMIDFHRELSRNSATAGKYLLPTTRLASDAPHPRSTKPRSRADTRGIDASAPAVQHALRNLSHQVRPRRHRVLHFDHAHERVLLLLHDLQRLADGRLALAPRRVSRCSSCGPSGEWVTRSWYLRRNRDGRGASPCERSGRYPD